jgi:hypothetical protein
MDIIDYQKNLGNTIGYDPFNRNDPAFTTRCVKIFDPLYHADTTLNYRINNYWSKLEPKTTGSCIFDGIVDTRINWTCDDNGEDVIYYFDDVTLNNPSTVNLDIASCPNISFDKDTVRYNPGFYVGILITTFFIMVALYGCITKNKASKYNLNKVYYSDYSSYKNKKVQEMAVIKEKVNVATEAADLENNPIKTESIFLEERKVNGAISLFTKVNPDKKKEERKEPKNSASPIKHSNDKLYLRDLDKIPYHEAITNDIDTRNWKEFLADYYIDRTFFSLVFKQSVLIPFWMRMSYCLLFLSILWMTNAMLFLDSYIEARIPLPQDVRVNIS